MRRQWWRRGRSPGGDGIDPRTGLAPQERAAAVRERLEVLELQRLELLADESVPGRKHRFDALRDATSDLEAELVELTGEPVGGR